MLMSYTPGTDPPFLLPRINGTWNVMKQFGCFQHPPKLEDAGTWIMYLSFGTAIYIDFRECIVYIYIIWDWQESDVLGHFFGGKSSCFVDVFTCNHWDVLKLRFPPWKYRTLRFTNGPCFEGIGWTFIFRDSLQKKSTGKWWFIYHAHIIHFIGGNDWNFGGKLL